MRDPMWLAYQRHRQSARQRGIQFLFHFETWKAWWLTDNRWANRGRHREQFVMARRYDDGPYSPDNVYCTTAQGNYFAVPQEKRLAAVRKGWINHPERVSHLKVRGEKHPRARPVKTQAGIFGSAALAAEAFEITRQEAARKAREKREGWEYVR
jgi:hypothetical protein